MTLSFLVAMIVISGEVSTAQGHHVLCVSPNGSPEASGECWDDPLDLKTALDTAEPGSEVWIKQGDYRPGTDPHSAFYLPEDVRVIGGYVGTTDSPEDRSENPALTILDGHDEHFTVIIVAGVSDAYLAGVTIRNGAATLIADDATDLQRRGGGVFVSNSTVEMSNVMIANNQARFGGGGIYVDEGSEITLNHVTFQGNRTTHPQSGRGGGLRLRAGIAHLSDVNFRFNQAIRGGGMFMDAGSSIVTNALFADNEAADRGGGLSVYSGEIEIDHSRFVQNIAVREGGGLFVSRAGRRVDLLGVEIHRNSSGDGGGGAWIQAGEVKIEQSQLTSNSGGLGTGGGLYISNAQVHIDRTVVSANQATRGGGVVLRNSESILVNTLIADNIATPPEFAIDLEAGRPPSDDPHRENVITDPWRAVITGEMFHSDYLRETLDERADLAGGGVLIFEAGETELVNATIAGNRSEGNGPAIYRTGENELRVFNSIVFGHDNQNDLDPDNMPDLIFSEADSADYARVLIENSLLERGCPDHQSFHCRAILIEDPRFMNASSADQERNEISDYRLWFTSPAVDAGNAYWVPEGVNFDLDGNDRYVQKRIDTDLIGSNEPLDLGAFETQVPAHLHDAEIELFHEEAGTRVSVDIRTDARGIATGDVSVETESWSFLATYLGRVYQRDDLIVIDGEALLDDSRLAGFVIESEVSSATGSIWAFRIRLDDGSKTIWYTLDTNAERRLVIHGAH
jgi:hypothetical protein